MHQQLFGESCAVSNSQNQFNPVLHLDCSIRIWFKNNCCIKKSNIIVIFIKIIATAIVIILLTLFVAIRFSMKYRRIRYRQWHVRDWLKTIRTKLKNIKTKTHDYCNDSIFFAKIKPFIKDVTD
jgi:hypothetical protein